MTNRASHVRAPRLINANHVTGETLLMARVCHLVLLKPSTIPAVIFVSRALLLAALAAPLTHVRLVNHLVVMKPI